MHVDAFFDVRVIAGWRSRYKSDFQTFSVSIHTVEVGSSNLPPPT